MPRLMSVALTEQAVRDRRKTVTRRLGWSTLQPGAELDLCRKVMGRRRGDPLVRIARVRVVSVTRERLDAITDDDVLLEGFTADDLRPWRPGPPTPNCGTLAENFVRFFCEHMKCEPSTEVTRVEWEYLPRPTSWPGHE